MILQKKYKKLKLNNFIIIYDFKNLNKNLKQYSDTVKK
jgi:hypothetical protein